LGNARCWKTRVIARVVLTTRRHRAHPHTK
jgi:hypothetical protein